MNLRRGVHAFRGKISVSLTGSVPFSGVRTTGDTMNINMAKTPEKIEIRTEMIASLIKTLYEEKRKLYQYNNAHVNGGN